MYSKIYLQSVQLLELHLFVDCHETLCDMVVVAVVGPSGKVRSGSPGGVMFALFSGPGLDASFA